MKGKIVSDQSNYGGVRMKREGTRAVWALAAVLALLCLGVAAQAVPEYAWDANTVVLDHLDGSTNGTSYGTLNYTAGVANQAGKFNSNNYIKYPCAWSGVAGTIEMWVYLRTWGIRLMDLQWNNAPSPPPAGYVGCLTVTSEGKLYFNAWPSGAITSNSTVPLNIWTHVAATWGTGLKLYINGVLDYQTTADAYAEGPEWAYMPHWGAGTSGPDLDEVRISSIARKFIPTNRPPVLSWTRQSGYATDGVQPESGAVGSTFSFRVNYSDPNGDRPAYVMVCVWRPDGVAISGSPFRMVNASGSANWSSGVIFKKQLSLARVGQYSYQFVASDGHATARMPLMAKHSGPVVTAMGTSSVAASGVSAQQVGDSVALTYTLSAPAEVQACVLNLAGRLIAQIPAGKQELGVQTLRWNGRNQAGSLSPAGVYLIRITARADDGASTQAVTTLNLRR